MAARKPAAAASKKKSKAAARAATPGKKKRAQQASAAKKKSRAKAPKQPEARMRWLEDELRRHQHLYYVKNRPEISDREFDRMLEELQQLEAEHPGLASEDSPTRQVGSDLDNEFPKFRHTIPVLSLGNTYSAPEALEWARKTAEESGVDTKIDVQWKIDGATLVAYYEGGRLKRAVTRGTGQVGDEITNNARTIRNLPARLARPVDLAVRGEVYMTFADFEEYNESLGNVYANPRNLAAGTLKHKKSSEVAKRPLRWKAFEGVFFENAKITDGGYRTEAERLAAMAELGLPVGDDTRVVAPSELEACIAEFEAARRKTAMPVDGLVLKIDNLPLREELGFTAASPRWATALKFEPEQAETTVRDIEVQTGRTGRVTPRAALEPVKLAGTTVSYATLHNADYIEKLDVRIGSRVRISKRGEIIPAVEEVIHPGKGKPYKFPKKCPSCGTKLIREKLGGDRETADWICPNSLCEAKILNRIIFFAARKQMDIGGMGERVCEILYENDFIRSLPDIYRLHARREELEELEGFGKKSVQVLLDGIEASKQREFRYVLPALGLREIGHSVTEILLSNGFHSMDRILALAQSEDAEARLNELDGVGPRTAQAILEQLNDPRILELIAELRKAGLRFASAAAVGPDDSLEQIFAGQSWCVTGSFEHFRPRDLALEEIKKRGGKTVSSVTSKTTHLLAGEGAGSKLAKAEQVGAEIVDEAQFRKRIGQA